MVTLMVTSEKEMPESMRKPGIYERNGVLYVIGDEYIERVASALSSPTRLQILRHLLQKEADVGEIAQMVGQSKANASAQIRRLEEAGLIRTIQTWSPWRQENLQSHC